MAPLAERKFMCHPRSQTLATAKRLRPNARFGNYDWNHCGTWGCSDALYYEWLKTAESRGGRPKTALPAAQPAPKCTVPNRAANSRGPDAPQDPFDPLADPLDSLQIGTVP